MLEDENAKGTQMEDKINDESKKTSTHTYYQYLVPGHLISGGTLCVLKKAQGSAPRATDAARYARARKDATETCKRGRKKRPMVIWCE